TWRRTGRRAGVWSGGVPRAKLPQPGNRSRQHGSPSARHDDQRRANVRSRAQVCENHVMLASTTAHRWRP
ncbi:MAG: hypothetical protein ACI39M_05915, partial [Streptomyces albidoflavus]